MAKPRAKRQQPPPQAGSLALKPEGSPIGEEVSGQGDDVAVRSLYGVAYLDVTGIFETSPIGSPIASLDVRIEAKDAITSQYFTIASFAQITDTVGAERLVIPDMIDGIIRAAWDIAGGSSSPPAHYDFTVTLAVKD